MIMANGDYGNNLNVYRQVLKEADQVLCADGGANYARILSVVPQCIIGDMDSIDNDVRRHFLDLSVPVKKYPRQKDFTDTQLALSEAQASGAEEIVLLGTMGRRLDHTLSNLYCCMDFVQQGIKVSHLGAGMAVHLVNKEVEIKGNPGDLVSVLVLSDQALGVCERGFEYPLAHAVLTKANPYTVSNRMLGEKGLISVEFGVLAVFHYFDE